MDITILDSALEAIASLSDNWDGHNSLGCNMDSLKNARRFLFTFPVCYLLGLQDFTFSLNEDGMVVLEIWLKTKSNNKITFDIYPSHIEVLCSYHEDVLGQRHRIFHHYLITENL